MKSFKEYITEKRLPTPGMIKKLLKSLNFEFIYPDFFEIEEKNTDAGMGGYDYIQINFDEDAAKSSKRASDVKLAIHALTTKYGAKLNKGYLTIS